MNAVSPHASPPPSREAPPPKQARTWKAGTLTYSSAGLAALFFWLLLGDFAWAMRDRSVGPISEWYLNHLGVSNLLFGLLLTRLSGFGDFRVVSR